MLKHAYVSGALVDDRGNFIDIEAAEHAKQDHLGLITRQARTNQRNGRVGPKQIESGDRRVVVGGTLAERLWGDGNTSPAGFTATRIGQTVARDREHPRPKSVLVAIEASEITGCCEPGLGLDVLSRGRIESPEEPEQPRMQVVPEDRDRPLLTLPGGREHLAEVARGQRQPPTRGSKHTCSLMSLPAACPTGAPEH